MTKPVLEWAPFRLAPGVSDEALLAASAALQRDFLSKQEGFLSRSLLRSADGSYVDVVWWASKAAVERAIGAVAHSPVCGAYFQLMAADAEAGAGVLLFEVLSEYGEGR